MTADTAAATDALAHAAEIADSALLGVSSGGAGQWVTPSSRPEHIQQLISGVDRYNPQNLDTLHDYLMSQLDNGTYDCLANLAILKLYQFNPADLNYVVVINILLKALTAAPLPDFQLCLALLGEAPLSPNFPASADADADAQKADDDDEADEEEDDGETGADGTRGGKKAKKTGAAAAAAPSVAASSKRHLAGNLSDPLITKLAHLSDLLVQARFREFWAKFGRDAEYDEVRKYAGEMSGFEESVRGVALEAVKGAFRTIGEERLGGYLDLQGGALKEYIAKQPGWKMEGGKVVVPVNVNNEIKATIIREEIPFDQFTKLLTQAA